MKATDAIGALFAAGAVLAGIVYVVNNKTSDERHANERALAAIQEQQTNRTWACYQTCMTCDLACAKKDPSSQKACSAVCYQASATCCNGVGAISDGQCGCVDGVSPDGSAAPPAATGAQAPTQVQVATVSTSLPIDQVGATYVALDPNGTEGKQLTLGQLSITGVMVSDRGKTKYDNLMTVSAPRYSCPSEHQCTVGTDLACTIVMTFQRDRLVVEASGGATGSACEYVQGQYVRGTLPTKWPGAGSAPPPPPNVPKKPSVADCKFRAFSCTSDCLGEGQESCTSRCLAELQTCCLGAGASGVDGWKCSAL